jgi:ribosome-binding factor A
LAKDYSRTQRVADFLHEELARLVQHAVRDPRVTLVNITAVSVSRDLSYAKVYYTQLGLDNAEQAAELTAVLNRAAGFLRSQIARASTMRTTPRLSFVFDESVGRGRDMETLLREVRAVDAARQIADEEE